MKSIFTLYLLVGSLCCSFGQAEDPVLRMKLLLLDDRFEDVVRLSDTLQVADSLLGLVHYFRGRAYQSMLNYDSAYHYFYMACQEDSTNLAFRISLGSAMYRTGRIREAIEMYREIVSKFQPGERLLAELADLYTIRKEYEKSLAIYKGLLERDSLNYYYARQAGRNYWEMNRPDSAIHYYELAFALNPHDVLIAHRLGNLHLLRGDPPTAIRRVSTGLAYDSANLDLLKLRGYLFLHDRQFTAAILDLEKAWLLDSLSVFTNKYLGMSYHEEKRFGDARSMLLRAFMLDSTDAETAFFLGNACRWSGHEEEAVGYFRKAIELRQPDPRKLKDIYLQLAELYKVLHRFEETFEAYDRALACDPSDNTIYFKIAQVYDRNLDKKKTAIEYYEKYLSGGSTNQQLFNTEDNTSTDLEQHVRERINRLKEALFFENQ